MRAAAHCLCATLFVASASASNPWERFDRREGKAIELDGFGGSHVSVRTDAEAALGAGGVKMTRATDERKGETTVSTYKPDAGDALLTLSERTVEAETNILLQGDLSGVAQSERESVTTRLAERITNRIDELGTRKAIVTVEGPGRVRAIIPHSGDLERFKSVLTEQGDLQLRMVDDSANVEEAKAGQLPPGTELLILKDGTEDALIVVETRIAVSGEHIERASAETDAMTGSPVISFRFDEEGTRLFAEATAANVGRRMAIVLDGTVISAPMIMEAITGGSGQISGNFTRTDADNLALVLRAGMLPVPVALVEATERTPQAGLDRTASLTGSGVANGPYDGCTPAAN